MADAPASMIEKYQILRQRAYELGKAFDPRIVKPALEQEYMERRKATERPTDLDIFPDDDVLPESEARARAIRFDDKSVAKAELDEMKKDAQAMLAKQAAENAVAAMQSARIAELEERLARQDAAIARLTGEAPAPDSAATAGQGDAPAPVLPTERWARPEIIKWIDEKGYELPPATRQAGTKADLLEFALGMAEQEA